MILILDNYDSFTYNLYQVFLKLNFELKVVRSDKITLKEIEKIKSIAHCNFTGTRHAEGCRNKYRGCSKTER